MQVGMTAAALFANGSIGAQPTPQQAAQEFEAMLIGQLIKAAREAGSTEDENSLAGADTYREFAEKYLAQALAGSGSFGFARMILRSLESGAPKGKIV
jgi:Rod binding domain-containing protein